MLATQQPVLRRFWYPVMPVSALAEGPKPFRLLGEDLVLWLAAPDRPAAASDRCCHRSARLSRGFCRGGRLVCGYHGWEYDEAGHVVRIPQHDSDDANPIIITQIPRCPAAVVAVMRRRIRLSRSRLPSNWNPACF